MRIAIVGTGISGLACAWLLDRRHDVVVYEEADRLGGHTHTLGVPWQGTEMPVDTGFIVYNERNYPNLARLFAHLGVATRPSDMSFGVSIDGGRLEYAGSSLRTLFAQKRNLLRPGFHRMWCDILRFNGDATRYLAAGSGRATLGEFLDQRRYGAGFCRHYLLPMAAAIWSATVQGMRAFPAQSLLRFFANHGLLQIYDRPQWRTVAGGARTYVDRLGAGFARHLKLSCPVVAIERQGHGIMVVDGLGGRQTFDQVVLACHADQALALIPAPTAAERAILGAFRYQGNRAVLHQDPALMPQRRSVWSSWNYLARHHDATLAGGGGVSVTYWLNHLQGLDPDCLLLESLNPLTEPAPETVLAELAFRHPQYDAEAVAAQARRGEIQGQGGLWFAGAYWGYGFHEDGLRSGLDVAAALGTRPPWWAPERVAEVTPIRRSAPRTMPDRAAAQPE
jgi:predicted NAD/FAD-binding protein